MKKTQKKENKKNIFDKKNIKVLFIAGGAVLLLFLVLVVAANMSNFISDRVDVDFNTNILAEKKQKEGLNNLVNDIVNEQVNIKANDVSENAISTENNDNIVPESVKRDIISTNSEIISTYVEVISTYSEIKAMIDEFYEFDEEEYDEEYMLKDEEDLDDEMKIYRNLWLEEGKTMRETEIDGKIIRYIEETEKVEPMGYVYVNLGKESFIDEKMPKYSDVVDTFVGICQYFGVEYSIERRYMDRGDDYSILLGIKGTNGEYEQILDAIFSEIGVNKERVIIDAKGVENNSVETNRGEE